MIVQYSVATHSGMVGALCVQLVCVFLGVVVDTQHQRYPEQDCIQVAELEFALSVPIRVRQQRQGARGRKTGDQSIHMHSLPLTR